MPLIDQLNELLHPVRWVILVVASVFLSLYLPCLGGFMVTLRELGARDAAKVFAMNFAAALAFASLLNLGLRFL